MKHLKSIHTVTDQKAVWITSAYKKVLPQGKKLLHRSEMSISNKLRVLEMFTKEIWESKHGII